MTQATTTRTVKRTKFNTSMDYIYVKALEFKEGQKLFTDLLNDKTTLYTGEHLTIPKRMRQMKKLPSECSCCKVKVDNFSIALLRTQVEQSADPELDVSKCVDKFIVVPTASGCMLNVDHIVPLSLGGLDVADNMQLTCYKCNSSKAHWMTKEDIDSVGDKLPNIINIIQFVTTYRANIKKFKAFTVRLNNKDKTITKSMVDLKRREIENARPIAAALFKCGINFSTYLHNYVKKA